MGLFTIRSANGLYLKAVQQSVTGTAANGQPTCGTPQTFTFSKFASNATTTLALPYGTYKIYSGSALNTITDLVGTGLNITPVPNALNGLLTTFNTSTGVLTLDPRPGS